MIKHYLVTLLTMLAPLTLAPTQAQVVVWKKGQTSIADSLDLQTADEPVAARHRWDSPRTLRLTPAAEPLPALRYRFAIPPVERRPGDVKAHVDRVVMMILQNPQRNELNDEYAQLSSALYSESDERVPPSEELRQRIRAHLDKFADVLNQLRYALSLDTVSSDYALRDMRGQDYYQYNLADVQNLRNLARLLQLECQLAVAEGRFEDAIVSVRDGYRVAELALRSGEGTIVSQLVSIAIVGLMDAEVEFMAQQAGSPNLYWALASLPSEQMFSIRSAFEGEAIGTLHALFPWGEEQSTASEQQAEARLLELVGLGQQAIEYESAPLDATQQAQQQSVAAIAVVLFADRARLELGTRELGNCQAVLEWAQRDFIRLRDEIFKWMLLPVQERRTHQDRVTESMQFLGGRLPDSPAKVLAGLILPAVQAADAAAQRTQRQHAFLVTLEALRAYAAKHDGEIPESLEDLYPLPAWSDPTTGKPFAYRRTAPHRAVLITEKSIGLPNEFHIEMMVPK